MDNDHTAHTTFSISDLAREFNITTRTIRYYEDKGLLHPQRQGQNRIYHPQDRVFLKLILRGKRLGFSLDESKEIIQLYDPTSGNQRQLTLMLERIAHKRQQLKEQLQDIELMQQELNIAEQNCRKALQNSHHQANPEFKNRRP